MSRHRAEPPPRYQPRYGRMVVLGVSLTTTAVALLGGIGVLPSSAGDRSDAPDAVVAADLTQVVDRADPTQDAPIDEVPSSQDSSEVTPEPDPTPDDAEPAVVEAVPVPDDSGDGRRVVFSESQQRVWMVGSAGKIKRTYLVSGSLTDNLQPGTYEVFDRSEDAFGIDDSGTMKWFVRFTRGPSGAAIGFHTIPLLDGKRVQGLKDLGTPQSHGCIRQSTPDALAMWDFAPVGTTVVVV